MMMMVMVMMMIDVVVVVVVVVVVLLLLLLLLLLLAVVVVADRSRVHSAANSACEWKQVSTQKEYASVLPAAAQVRIKARHEKLEAARSHQVRTLMLAEL